MKHRVFIAINLPENIKKKLVDCQGKYPELPIRWTRKDNLHITLEFLGYLSEEDLLETCQRTREQASKQDSFSVTLNKICYGPPKKIPPRMVWAVGDKIQEFNLSPHITLGRIKTWEWKKVNPEERPEVAEEINLSFDVDSIEVMESQLKRGGPEYAVLESCPFKD